MLSRIQRQEPNASNSDEQLVHAPRLETKTVALLDVDQTLVNDQNELNEKLIASLLSEGIRDVYLFTHMSLSDIINKTIDPRWFSRKQLIDNLQARGFKVHGVLTSADPSYGRGLGAAFQDLYLPQYERIGQPLTEENIQQDAAFQEGNGVFRKKILDTKIQAEQNGYQSVKGEMYKYFLQNRPAWVGSALFFDDDQVNLDDAILAGAQVAPLRQLKLTTVKVNKNFNETFNAAIKKHQAVKPNVFGRIQANIEKHPRIWGAIKWLALGALAATALYFSGGLAALPYVAQLGAWAIPAVTPILATAEAVLWTYVLKPIGARLLKICGFPRTPARSASLQAQEEISARQEEPQPSPSPTHSRVLRELEVRPYERLAELEEKASDSIEKTGEEAWYFPVEVEKLIFAPTQAARSSNGLKCIFIDQDEYGNGPSFKLQLERLRMIKNKTKAPFAYFISKAPGSFNTSHYIMGLLVNDRLLIIDPVGESSHGPFYEQLEAAREKKQLRGQGPKVEELIVSSTPIQKDTKALVNCGPICAELLRHLSSLPAEQLTGLLASAEKTQRSHELLPDYQAIDLAASGLLPASLQGLVKAEPSEYAQRIQALRQQQQQILGDKTLNLEYCDDRDLMNAVILEKRVDLFALEEDERLKRLRARFASNGSSFGPGSGTQFSGNNASQLRSATTKETEKTHTYTGPQ